MAKPEELLSGDDLERYKKLSVRSQRVAEEFLARRTGEIVREKAAAAASAVPTIVSPPPPISYSSDEIPADEGFISSGYETESERLKRDADKIRQDIIDDSIINELLPEEDVGLPPVEAGIMGEDGPLEKQERYVQATPSTILAAPVGTPIVEKAPAGDITGLTVAAPINEYKAKLTDEERKAYDIFFKQMTDQGASQTEAQSRAQQLTNAIVRVPRDFSTYAAIEDADTTVDPEKYASGEYGFGKAFERKPLESASALKIRKSRAERSAELNAQIEDEVNRDLSRYVFLDEAQRSKARDDTRRKKISEHRQAIETEVTSILLMNARQDGTEIKPGSPEFIAVQDQAKAIGELWQGELRGEPAKPEAGLLQKGLEFVMTDTAPSGQLMESRTGAFMRSLGGAWRVVTQPLIRSLTYDVKADGTPVDPEDTNYLVDKGLKEAYIAINKGEGDAADYLQKYNPLAYVIGGAREVGSGITKKPELSSGNYLNDVAFAVAVGRSLGDDFSDLPAAQYYYGEDSMIPFYLGLGVEIALPINPLEPLAAVVGGAKLDFNIAKFGMASSKLTADASLAGAASRVGLTKTSEFLQKAGQKIASPISSGLAPMVGEMYRTSQAAKIAELVGAPKPSMIKAIAGTKPVSEYIAEILTPQITKRLNELEAAGEAVPAELAELNLLRMTARDILSFSGSEDLQKVTGLSERLSETSMGKIVSAALIADSKILVRAALKAKKAGLIITLEQEDLIVAYSTLARSIGMEGKVSRIELQNLAESYAIYLDTLTIDGQLSKLEELNNLVSNTVIRGRLLEDLAKTDYNNWLFISPTAIVRTSTWEKVGAKIDASVKSAIWGTENPAKAVVDGIVTIPRSGRKALFDAIQSEVGPVKVGRAKYWSEISTKLKDGATLTVDEFNDVVDLLRTSTARKTLKGGEVVTPSSASKLTERSAVPLNRRVPSARLTEDLLRIPVQKISNMDLAAAISRVGRSFGTGRVSTAIQGAASVTGAVQRRMSTGASAIRSVFTKRTIAEIIEGSKAPLPIVNLVRQSQVKINMLLEGFTGEMRELIKGGMSGPEALNEKIVLEIFGDAIVNGATTVDKLKPIYRDFLTRFFGLSADAEDIARTIDTVIDDVLKPLGDNNGIIDASIFRTGKRSYTIDILDLMVEELKKDTSFLKPRGLANLFGQKAYTELIVAKILDQRLSGVVKELGAEILAKHPEIVIGSSKADDIAIVLDKVDEAGKLTRLEEELTTLIRETNRIDPSGLTRPDAPNLLGLQRRVSNALVDYTNARLISKSLTGPNLNNEIRQIYFNTLNDIINDGILDIALLSEKAKVSLREKLYGPVYSRNAAGQLQFSDGFYNGFAQEMEAVGSEVVTNLSSRGISAQPGMGINFATILDEAANAGALEGRMKVVIGATVDDALQLRVQDIIAKLDTLGFKFSTESRGFEALNYVIKDMENYVGLLDPETAKLIDDLSKQNRFWQEAVEELAIKNNPAASWWEGSVRGVLQTARRNLFGGMLGGIWSLNGRFLGPNNITAPLIAAVTSPGYFLTVLKAVPGSFARPFVRAAETANAPLSAGFGGAVAGAIVGAGSAGPTGAFLGAIGGGLGVAGLTKLAASEGAVGRGMRYAAEWLSTDTIKNAIVTPSGKVYDKAALRKVFERNVYVVSQAKFDVSSGIAQDMMRALEVNSEGMSPSLVETIRRSVGPFTRNTSFANDVGSQADYVFREAVFEEALRRGLQEGEAANLARNTLLDYAAIPEAERKLIASWNMFYSFGRQMAVESVVALGRPGAQNAFFKQVMINKKLEEEYLRKQQVLPASWSEGRMFTGAGDKIYDGYRTLFYGPGLPQVQSIFKLFGGLYTIYDAWNKERLLGLGAAVFYETVTGTPGGEFMSGMGEVLSPREDAAHGMFPANMIVNTTQILDYEGWNWVKERYYLEPVKDKDGNAKIIAKGEPTWGGYQWKFGNEQGKYNFLLDQMIAQQLGFQRTLNDWAATSAKVAGVDPAGAELKRGKDGNWFLYTTGVQTALKAPDWLTAQDNASRQIIKELQELKSGKAQPYKLKGADLGKPTREITSTKNIILSPFEKQKMLDEAIIQYQKEGMSREAAIAKARQDVAKKEMDISRGN